MMEVSRPAVPAPEDPQVARPVTVAEGTRRVYAVDTRSIDSVRKWLEGLWDEALTAFEVMAEREASRDRKQWQSRRCPEVPMRTSVRKVLTVQAPQAVAWRVFTEKTGAG